ncbi:hypothetical protein KAX17_01830 [Candidatus Bipolaricaulota bacterium]|nr:hypothetical protein [Candidatus Bipolaricaulota bacterium]
MAEVPAEWTPEKIQFALLVTLHKQYMKDHRVPVKFSEAALTDEDPSWKEVERELIQLEHSGWIRFITDLMYDNIGCRLTPEGRLGFEQLREELELPGIGFGVTE